MSELPPAGPALDRLVAEGVMGKVKTPALTHGRFAAVPPYSTDIAAAFMVVEALSKRGFYLRINSPFQPGTPWFAGFTPHGVTGWNDRHEAGGESAPLVICRAALLVAPAIPG